MQLLRQALNEPSRGNGACNRAGHRATTLFRHQLEKRERVIVSQIRQIEQWESDIGTQRASPSSSKSVVGRGWTLVAVKDDGHDAFY
jgi:hypothetical protein